MFEMKSENRDFLKDKLKDICFSILKSYSLDKVEKKKISKAESIALESLIERKDPDIQKADIGNTGVITDRTKYLEEIKSLLSDSSKFMQLPIDEGSPRNSPRQSAIAEGFAEANSIFKVITSAKILPRK